MPLTFLLFICLFFGFYFVEEVKSKHFQTSPDQSIPDFNLNYGCDLYGKNP